MRPGHCAPEKEVGIRRDGRMKLGFNEAGALCPGKGIPGKCPGGSCRSFNEAGALCPGKGSHFARYPPGFLASMRPGHCAPEKVSIGRAQKTRSGTLQ